ncbi:hypothetical protein HanRHA438_Chr07g0305481 [Helianthus annuus]|nr:hypothetical protein HanIR_Chr07g0318551 [Helianthus annuus]KAJ0907997.1 hypothetical protein HanRHA438_Chr07g0305481 [Helianthus annuus]
MIVVHETTSFVLIVSNKYNAYSAFPHLLYMVVRVLATNEVVSKPFFNVWA